MGKHEKKKKKKKKKIVYYYNFILHNVIVSIIDSWKHSVTHGFYLNI